MIKWQAFCKVVVGWDCWNCSDISFMSQYGMFYILLSVCQPRNLIQREILISFYNNNWQASLHPEQDRVLTLREFARLQGFPDYYRFCGTVKERFETLLTALKETLCLNWQPAIKMIIFYLLNYFTSKACYFICSVVFKVTDFISTALYPYFLLWGSLVELVSKFIK